MSVWSLFIIFPHITSALNTRTFVGVGRLIPGTPKWLHLLLVIMPKKKAVCEIENMIDKPAGEWRIQQEV